LLKGKIAVITGAGRGIGRAIARGFAREGADVVLLSRTLGEVEATARLAREYGRKAIAICADVSVVDDVEKAARTTADRFGRVDVLVNNAALRMNYLGDKNSYFIPFTDLTIEDWDRTIAVNLRGPFLCVKKFLPLMQRGNGASIINISAGAGKKGMAGRSPYCASKFGLEGLTQSLAVEFKTLNIVVNSLSPGTHSILTDEAKREVLIQRPETLYMKPEIMVPPALFLAAQDGSGITGEHFEAFAWCEANGYGGTDTWRASS
jgi:NAD(P)-dependent dehydrogenase (short-subunit alcohol dehydrogenase family)